MLWILGIRSGFVRLRRGIVIDMNWVIEVHGWVIDINERLVQSSILVVLGIHELLALQSRRCFDHVESNFLTQSRSPLHRGLALVNVALQLILVVCSTELLTPLAVPPTERVSFC